MNKVRSDGTLVDRIVELFKTTTGKPFLEQVRVHLEFSEAILPESVGREQAYAKLREAYHEAAEITGGQSAIIYALID